MVGDKGEHKTNEKMHLIVITFRLIALKAARNCNNNCCGNHQGYVQARTVSHEIMRTLCQSELDVMRGLMGSNTRRHTVLALYFGILVHAGVSRCFEL